ncbi:hypothetical protein [Actinoplanes sp. L3-i22]|uniref:hypothetical protein n=1 Tax=Actinoplanes sp. L3-i22 TaxID=2836373 RepID=UPI001C7918A4|nr:hypothetical protein [Actinoplanes sp. L3-i22]BCY15511.1 hypothetical protein L3i22_105990 [Actinoplanes sp. L3-i22]
MSEYGYLLCVDCRVYIWLGKAIQDDTRIIYFAVGSKEPNWRQPELAKSVWKFLADHVGHPLESVREFSQRYDQMVADDPPEGEYSEVGDTSHTGPTFEEYLSGWPGSR